MKLSKIVQIFLNSCFLFCLKDQKMLISVSLSERVKLWDKFHGPVSQDALKLHFLNKVNKRNPPFRRKVKLPVRKCIVVSFLVE